MKRIVMYEENNSIHKGKIFNKDLVLYGEGQGEVLRCKTLWEAYNTFKEIKKEDKRNKLKDEYYWTFEVEYLDYIEVRNIKFYVRNNKMFYKFI